MGLRISDALQLLQSSLLGEREFRELQEALRAKGSLWLRVASASMQPCLAPGDLVEVRPCAGEPRRFDIVVYWDGRNLVVHVYWHANSGDSQFVARGLARGSGEDLPAPRDRILGVVTSHRLSLRQRIAFALRRS